MESFNLYFKYEHLPAATVARLLNDLDRLYRMIQRSIIDSHSTEIPSRYGQEFMLLMESVYTGNSITFKFKDGWKPTARYTGGADSWSDVEIGIPKKFGAAFVVGHLLLLTASHTIAFQNELLDNQIKKCELEIVKQEHKDIIRSFSTRQKLEHTIEADTVLLQLMDIPGLSDLKINDIMVYTTTDQK